ncbi:hypothetical protein LG288_10120 [Idiomarina seosinensis]|uniref:hypothetical protein n=1 Tax=Idiomarina seosinensis TaxID=281739 RepID=UPI00384AD001
MKAETTVIKYDEDNVFIPIENSILLVLGWDESESLIVEQNKENNSVVIRLKDSLKDRDRN